MASIRRAMSCGRPDVHRDRLGLFPARRFRARGLSAGLRVEELLVGQCAAPPQQLCGNDPQGCFSAAAIRFAFGYVVHPT